MVYSKMLEGLMKSMNVDKEFVDKIIKIDELSQEEIDDIPYMVDRIEAHLSFQD